MSWSLAIYDETGTLQRTFTSSTDPNGIMDQPSATVNKDGRVEQLTVRVVNTVTLIEPRFLLEYKPDAVNAPTVALWGVVLQCPAITSPGAGPADDDSASLERVTAVGLERLLKDRIVGPRLLDRAALVGMGSADIATVAHELSDLYAHPVVIVDALNFPMTGTNIGLYYGPEQSLATALDELAGLVDGGARWWVNESRELCFEGIGGS